MIRLLLLAVLLILPLSAVAADTCTFPAETCNWTAICTESCSGSISCAGGDSSCDAADSFVIPSGATVTVTSGSTVTQTGTTADVTIQSGGALVVLAGGQLDVADDLVTDSGGTLTLTGLVMENDGNATFTGTVLDSTVAFPVGDILHGCGDNTSGTGGEPVEDVAGGQTDAGDPSETCICYPAAKYDNALPTDRDFPAVLAALAVDDQIIIFDPSSNRGNPSRDINAHYKITDTQYVNQTLPCIVVDTAGSWLTTTEVPIGERDIQKITLDAAVLSGDRTVTFTADAIIGAAHDFEARYLTCEDAQGNFPGPVAIIFNTKVQTHDTTADTITLQPGGFTQDVASGAECYIDYGLQTGDTIAFYRPAEVGTGNTGGQIRCDSGSTCDFDFVFFNEVGMLQFEGTSHQPPYVLNIHTATGTNTGQHAVELQDAAGLRSDYVQIVGGDHGYVLDTNSANANDGVVINDLVVRWANDDNICLGAGADSPVTGIQINRFRSSFSTGDNGSQSSIDACVETSHDVTVNGFYFQYGVGPSTPNVSAINEPHPDGGVWNVSNGAMFGGESMFTNVSTGNFKNIYVGGVITGTSGLHFTHFNTFSNFTFRDYTLGTGVRPMVEPAKEFTSVSHGIFRNVAGTREFYLSRQVDNGSSTVTNSMTHIAAINIDTTFAGEIVLDFEGAAGDTQLEVLNNWTVAWTPGTQTLFDHCFDYNIADATVRDTYRDHDGFLCVNGDLTTGTFIGVDGTGAELAIHTNLCLGNLEQLTDGISASLHSTAITDTAFRFVDPYIGNFQLTPDSPGYGVCGAMHPGVIPESNWGLKASHYDARANGDTWRPATSGGGGGTGPRAVP